MKNEAGEMDITCTGIFAAHRGPCRGAYPHASVVQNSPRPNRHDAAICSARLERGCRATRIPDPTRWRDPALDRWSPASRHVKGS
jgi:hypothetical protein